jgi:hypothetical protein
MIESISLGTQKRWLFNAPLDLFFIANLAWPLVVYLCSLSTHYGIMATLVHFGHDYMAFCLSLANAFIHAFEYFAIVTWTARKRASKASDTSPFARVSREWLPLLLCFIGVIACGSILMDAYAARFWLVFSMLASFLHFAYDGIIWKMPVFFFATHTEPISM